MTRTIAALCLIAAPILAQQVTHIQPEGLSKPTAYTHVVTVQGKVAYISGQVSADAQGNVVGRGDLKAQTTQVFENLKKALASVGATFSDVIKINTYVVNMKPATDLPVIREVRSRYMTGKPPASTLVGVQSLANADWLIEIEAVAALK